VPDASEPDKPEKPRKKKSAATIASAILWILGFGLAFVIPGNSNYMWVPDTFLLLGFFPVMYVYPAGWTWVVFGILNTAIGFILEIGYHLPDDQISPEVNTLRKGLQATHPTLVWILLGVACTIFGIVRMAKNTYQFFRRRAQKKQAAQRDTAT
jgi:hypothetical protein